MSNECNVNQTLGGGGIEINEVAEVQKGQKGGRICLAA